MELRLGLVGCGRLAERAYVAAIERAQGVRLTAVADVLIERCRALAPDLPAFSTAHALVEARVVDALLLATPAEAHVADARVAADHGVPMLIEKPPAPDLAGAVELARLDPAPWLGFNRRFDLGLETLRRQIPPKAALELELILHARRATWRPYVVNDDVLLDLGSHLVDLALWLAGAETRRVRATASRERASLSIELGDDRGQARIECALDRPFRERFEIRDLQGRRIGSRSDGGIARNLVTALWRAPVGRPLVASLTRQLEALARAVGGTDEPHLATAQDGVRVMAVLDAARRSAAQRGSWEPIATHA